MARIELLTMDDLLGEISPERRAEWQRLVPPGQQPEYLVGAATSKTKGQCTT
jgi:hypothetical protein